MNLDIPSLLSTNGFIVSGQDIFLPQASLQCFSLPKNSEKISWTQEIPLEKSSQKPLLFYFWSPGCEVAQDDLLILQKDPKVHQVFRVYPIAFGFSDAQDVVSVTRSLNFSWPMCLDNGGVFQERLSVLSCPAVFLWDPTGHLVAWKNESLDVSAHDFQLLMEQWARKGQVMRADVLGFNGTALAEKKESLSGLGFVQGVTYATVFLILIWVFARCFFKHFKKNM